MQFHSSSKTFAGHSLASSPAVFSPQKKKKVQQCSVLCGKFSTAQATTVANAKYPCLFPQNIDRLVQELAAGGSRRGRRRVAGGRPPSPPLERRSSGVNKVGWRLLLGARSRPRRRRGEARCSARAASERQISILPSVDLGAKTSTNLSEKRRGKCISQLWRHS